MLYALKKDRIGVYAHKHLVKVGISIPEETDRAVRSFLARKGGKKGDLSKFANDAVRREILRQTVIDIQEQNAHLGEKEAASLANEAVGWTRAHHSRYQ